MGYVSCTSLVGIAKCSSSSVQQILEGGIAC
jgi:hypothetical protein